MDLGIGPVHSRVVIHSVRRTSDRDVDRIDYIHVIFIIPVTKFRVYDPISPV